MVKVYNWEPYTYSVYMGQPLSLDWCPLNLFTAFLECIIIIGISIVAVYGKDKQIYFKTNL